MAEGVVVVTEEKPLIPLFASFQDYLSNDQEIREVGYISSCRLCVPAIQNRISTCTTCRASDKCRL